MGTVSVANFTTNFTYFVERLHPTSACRRKLVLSRRRDLSSDEVNKGIRSTKFNGFEPVFERREKKESHKVLNFVDSIFG